LKEPFNDLVLETKYLKSFATENMGKKRGYQLWRGKNCYIALRRALR